MFIHLSYLCAGGSTDVSLENPESFLKVDESAMGKEFDLTMMLIVVVSSMPNDVSGATHGAYVSNQLTHSKLTC